MRYFIYLICIFMVFSCQKKQYATFQIEQKEDFKREVPLLTEVKTKIAQEDIILSKNDPEIINVKVTNTLTQNAIAEEKGIKKKSIFFKSKRYISQDTLKNKTTESIDATHLKKSKVAGIIGIASILLTILGIITLFTSTLGFPYLLLLVGGLTAFIGFITSLLSGKDSKNKKSKMAKIGIRAAILYLILLLIGIIIFLTTVNPWD